MIYQGGYDNLDRDRYYYQYTGLIDAISSSAGDSIFVSLWCVRAPQVDEYPLDSDAFASAWT